SANPAREKQKPASCLARPPRGDGVPHNPAYGPVKPLALEDDVLSPLFGRMPAHVKICGEPDITPTQPSPIEGEGSRKKLPIGAATLHRVPRKSPPLSMGEGWVGVMPPSLKGRTAVIRKAHPKSSFAKAQIVALVLVILQYLQEDAVARQGSARRLDF